MYCCRVARTATASFTPFCYGKAALIHIISLILRNTQHQSPGMIDLPAKTCISPKQATYPQGLHSSVQARGGVAVARRGKAKPGRARGLFAPPSKQVLDRSDSKLGKRRRTADYDFGDVIMPPLPGAKAVAQLPVSSIINAIVMTITIIIIIITLLTIIIIIVIIQ